MKKLPNKLSKLMRIALADITKVERSKNMSVRMSSWLFWDGHSFGNTTSFKSANKLEHCYVCFAGAVMAKTLDVVDDYEVHTDPVLGCKIIALDFVRQGYVFEALDRSVGFKSSEKWLKHYEDNIKVVTYHDNPKQWRKDMWKIVRKLEKIGL